MDGLIEQMLDGLFRMAEKVTRAPYKPHPRPLSKGRGEWNEPGTEEGTQPAIAKSEESKEFTTNGLCREAGKEIHNSCSGKRPEGPSAQLTADCSDPQPPNLGGSAKEVPVRKRRRQRVKMVEGTLFE